MSESKTTPDRTAVLNSGSAILQEYRGKKINCAYRTGWREALERIYNAMYFAEFGGKS